MKYKIPYGKQSIDEADIQAVTEALTSEFITTGPRVQEFEEKFAAYVGSKYAVAVSSGTAALHLCALALGVKPGQKVITTPITFAASANCVRYCGGEVDFVDIHPDTLTMDPDLLSKKLASHPKGTYAGVIPVDFAGRPAKLEIIRAICDEYGLWMIEDACHAPGGFLVDSSNTKQNCGNGHFADLAIFSFHPVKHIACGEGGMVTTNDEVLYKKVKQLRTHGMVYQGDERLEKNDGPWYMELQELGFNYRIPDILCALGISQLKKADQGLKRRQEIAKKYDEAFANTNIRTHIPDQNESHAYHLYVVEVDNRKEMFQYLREHGIFAQIHYVPCHLMPYYRQFGWKEGDFPYAEAYYQRCLSIPIYPTLTEEEQDFVIETMKSFHHG